MTGGKFSMFLKSCRAIMVEGMFRRFLKAYRVSSSGLKIYS